jgi:phosphohistidine phosphatase SixA
MRQRKKHNLDVMRTHLLVVCLGFCLASCSPATRLYFVRHAEKASTPVGDPGLSEAGRERAEELAGMLRDKDVRAIHVTETRRSRQTAEPLSLQTGLPLTPYSTDTVHRFLFQLLEAERNALVVGHSNTVMGMLREMGLKPSKEALGEGDYDGLWVVVQKEKEGRGGYRLSLRERTYGLRTPARDDSLRKGKASASVLKSRVPSRSTSAVSR